MKIDLRKLYSLGKENIKDTVTIPETLFNSMNILKMDPVNVNGYLEINEENNIHLNLNVDGAFIMQCAITLDNVSYDYSTIIDDIILETTLNDDIFLDLLPIIWENIVLEVPIRVVKDGTEVKDIHGDGWQLTSEND